MDSLVIGLIVVVGTLAAFIIAVSLPVGDNIECDLDCKEHFESQGMVCQSDSFNDYSCRQLSEHGVDIVIPWGSATMPNERNFIPSSITVSLGITNTVRWTNVDDVPHIIVSDDGLFQSPILRPNQTWSYVFDKVGHYGYHGEPNPWLKGEVNVIPLDPHYHEGQAITHMVFPDLNVEYHLVRESDRLGYVSEISIIDNNKIEAHLKDYLEVNPNSMVFNAKMQVGDKITGGCYTIGEKSRVSYLTLERIVTQDTPYAAFREERKTLEGKQCNFEQFFTGVFDLK